MDMYRLEGKEVNIIEEKPNEAGRNDLTVRQEQKILFDPLKLCHCYKENQNAALTLKLQSPTWAEVMCPEELLKWMSTIVLFI